MGKVIINKDQHGWFFQLYAGNGQPVIRSNYYTSKEGCKRGLTTVTNLFCNDLYTEDGTTGRKL